MRFLSVIAVPLLFTCLPASALEYSRSGDRILLSGPIRIGDENAVLRFMKDPQNTSAHQVWLNSPGGSVNSAIEIARHIRGSGMTTVVDARSSHCESACTALFGAGVRRHYINTQGMSEGIQAFGGTGLGFHQATTSLSRQPGGFSGAGTAMMIGIYYEMGISGANNLADKAPPNKIYRLSGQSALALGIATSLNAP